MLRKSGLREHLARGLMMGGIAQAGAGVAAAAVAGMVTAAAGAMLSRPQSPSLDESRRISSAELDGRLAGDEGWVSTPLEAVAHLHFKKGFFAWKFQVDLPEGRMELEADFAKALLPLAQRLLPGRVTSS